MLCFYGPILVLAVDSSGTHSDWVKIIFIFFSLVHVLKLYLSLSPPPPPLPSTSLPLSLFLLFSLIHTLTYIYTCKSYQLIMHKHIFVCLFFSNCKTLVHKYMFFILGVYTSNHARITYFLSWISLQYKPFVKTISIFCSR